MCLMQNHLAGKDILWITLIPLITISKDRFKCSLNCVTPLFWIYEDAWSHWAILGGLREIPFCFQKKKIKIYYYSYHYFKYLLFPRLICYFPLILINNLFFSVSSFKLLQASRDFSNIFQSIENVCLVSM